MFSKIVIHTVVMNVESDPATLDRAASARIDGSKSRGLAWRNLSDNGPSLELFTRCESRLDAQYDRAVRRLEVILKQKQQTNPGSR